MTQNKLKVKGVSSLRLLNAYGEGVSAAYSLRKLSSNYNGPVVRVRRSSDNTETNIGFSGEQIDLTALTSFVGGGNGYVVMWYDQSGNNRNGYSSWAHQQPFIIKNGSVVTTQNGKPAISAEYGSNVGGFSIYNSVSNSYEQFNYKTLIMVSDPDETNIQGSGRNGFVAVGDHYWETLYSYGADGKAGISYIGNARTYTGATPNYNLFYTNFRNNNVYMSFNNGEESNLGSWTFTTPTAKALFKVWDQYGSWSYGKFNELIMWNLDKTSVKTNILSNINNHYSIY